MKTKEALSEIIGFKKRNVSQQEIGKVLGVTKQYISQIMNKELTEEQLKLLEQHFQIDFTKVNKEEDKMSVDYYPEVFGSCGSGKFVLSEQKELIQVPKKFFSHYSSAKKYSLINAVGESMMPNIHPKDRLIVEHWAGEQIRDNQIYVFCYNNEIFVKRLIKNVDEVVIKSDNPDPAYRTRFIEKSDMNNLLIIGEIVGLMRDMRL